MEVEVLDNFTAISFLANGSGVDTKPILLKRVSWQEYECFLKDFEEKAGWKLAYDNGDLEIMPPLPEHEQPKDNFYYFVYEYCRHFDLPLETRGSMTFRGRKKIKGVEPDFCFYVQNYEKVVGLSSVKSENYPIPDVAVEIDVTHGSLDKFKIYAALGMAELWIYSGQKVVFYQLAGGEYRQTETSAALPHLTAAVLTEFVQQSQRAGQTVALKSFRQWLKQIIE